MNETEKLKEENKKLKIALLISNIPVDNESDVKKLNIATDKRIVKALIGKMTRMIKEFVDSPKQENEIKKTLTEIIKKATIDTNNRRQQNGKR